MRSVVLFLKRIYEHAVTTKNVFSKQKTNRNLKKQNLWILHDTSDWCFLIFVLYFSRKPFKKGIATKVDRSTISSRAQPANHWPLSDLFINNIVFKTGNTMAPESFPGWKSQKMEVWLVPIFVSCSKRWVMFRCTRREFSGVYWWLQGGKPTLPVQPCQNHLHQSLSKRNLSQGWVKRSIWF